MPVSHLNLAHLHSEPFTRLAAAVGTVRQKAQSGELACRAVLSYCSL